MKGCRRFMLLGGLGLLALAGGCQSDRSGSNGGGGPSLSFGQNYVPSQSEPPVETAGAGPKIAARSAPADAGDDLDGEVSSAAAPRKARWLPGSDKDPPRRKTIPVSARTDSLTDDDQDR